MAEDRKENPESQTGAESGDPPRTAATPNRDRRREPPVIDARPGEVHETPVSPAPPEEPVPASQDPAPALEKPAPPPSRLATGRRPGLAAPLLAGVAGAVMALAIGYAYTSTRLYSAQETDAAIAAAVQKAGGDAAASTASAQKKFADDLARQNASLDSLGRRLADLEARLTGALEKQGAATPAPSGAAPVDLAPLEAGLGDLEKRISTIETALNAPKTDVRADPENRTPEANATAAPPAALAANLAALAERLRALEARPQQRVDLAPLQTRLQQLEQKLAPLESAFAKSAALGDTVTERLKSAEAGKERADAAALAVVARTLSDAVGAGVSFAPLLKAAEALGADPAAIQKLAPLAEKGAPAVAALASQFAPLGEAMVEAQRAPAPNATISERLAAGAGKLVRLRPAEDSSEETVEALVARINAALRTGRLADAQQLFAKLPAPAQARAKDWAAALQARRDAEQSTQSILAAALTRLSRP